MSEVFYIIRDGQEKQVNKLIFEAYCKLQSEEERQRFFDSLNTKIHISTSPKEPATQASVEATLAQRGSRYGDFTDHARLCQGLMSEMICFNPKANTGLCPWEKLDPVKKQALTVIMDKIARILSGDPNYDDNWHDIQGYAKLVEDRLPKKS